MSENSNGLSHPSKKRNLVLLVVNKLFPRLAYKLKQKYWNRAWMLGGQSPESLTCIIPTELEQAVKSQWFKSGCKIFDIGCGRGHISSWLADREYDVLGGDYSEVAIKLANKHYGNTDKKLCYQVVDVCIEQPTLGCFDGLIDRGCYHGIAESFKPQYVNNILSWCKKGSKFLLLTRYEDSKEAMTEEIKKMFGPYFEIEKLNTTIELIQRSIGHERAKFRGLCVWMIRS